MRIIIASREDDKSAYLKALANGVIKEYNDYFQVSDLECNIGDDTMSFEDNGTVIYIQPIADITPNPDDLEADIEELAEEVIGAAIPNF